MFLQSALHVKINFENTKTILFGSDRNLACHSVRLSVGLFSPKLSRAFNLHPSDSNFQADQADFIWYSSNSLFGVFSQSSNSNQAFNKIFIWALYIFEVIQSGPKILHVSCSLKLYIKSICTTFNVLVACGSTYPRAFMDTTMAPHLKVQWSDPCTFKAYQWVPSNL